jgi:biopolymer transport protein ExbD
MRIKIPPRRSAEINLTPIIDMVFLLLIFFLIATKFADEERDIRVSPPYSHHAKPITAIPEEIIVNITTDGRFLVVGQQRSLEDLDRLFGMAAAQNPNQAIIVRGDGSSVLQFAVNVLDLCEKHAIQRTYLTTSAAEE